MKVYIIAAMSTDGFIAKSSDEFIDWTSPEDKKIFAQMTTDSGVIIMGGKTFRTMPAALKNRKNIVYSKQTIDDKNVETTQENPVDLVNRLKSEGYKSVAVCGGQTIYRMFLEANLVNDLYLTTEPLLFGRGISLSGSDLDLKLKLVSTKKLNENTVFSHYKVIN